MIEDKIGEFRADRCTINACVAEGVIFLLSEKSVDRTR